MSYISEGAPQAAIDVLERALDVAVSLSTLAERGRIVPELSMPNVRELFVYQYRLLYRVEESQVVVIAFVHGARDFATWRRELRVD